MLEQLAEQKRTSRAGTRSRRDFLKSSPAVVSAGLAASLLVPEFAHAKGDDTATLKTGLIGSDGCGSSAAQDAGKLTESKNITKWVKLCSVGKDFRPTDGDTAAVANAVRQGADLRRFSTYSPKQVGLVEETMSLQTTWVFDHEHVGGLATLRQPIDCGLNFHNGPCIAYYIFNVAAPTCVVFVPLDGSPMDRATGNWVRVDNHSFDDYPEWLSERYYWWARNEWEEICAHDEDGNPSLGNWEQVRHAANDGCTLKVGIRNLWNVFTPPEKAPLEHEVFIECGVQFAHVDAHFVGALTLPTFLVRPCTPLKFSNEDFAPGWLLVRTDGRVQHQTLDPSTLNWERTWARHAMRWFAS